MRRHAYVLYVLLFGLMRMVCNIMSLVEIRSATITDKGQIAIPGRIHKTEGFKKGSIIVILAFDDHIELRPMKQISQRLATAVASEKSLAKDWDSKEEQKAWKNL